MLIYVEIDTGLFKVLLCLYAKFFTGVRDYALCFPDIHENVYLSLEATGLQVESPFCHIIKWVDFLWKILIR